MILQDALNDLSYEIDMLDERWTSVEKSLQPLMCTPGDSPEDGTIDTEGDGEIVTQVQVLSQRVRRLRYRIGEADDRLQINPT